jgi:hypothetical protein
MPTFATPGPVTATVEVAGAQVRVTASDRTDTVVLVEPRNPASRRDVKVAGKTKVDLADGRLTVKTITPGDKTGSVVITIDLPADRIDALRANISAGEVAIAHIAGRADIEGGAFAVRIGEVDGPVGITGSGGQAWTGRAASDLELSSSSGGFDIDRADGAVADIDVSSERGAVRNSVAPPSPDSPDPSDRKVTVHARTRHGDIIVHRAAS